MVRACSRCKCRYLGRFEVDDDNRPVRRVLRGQHAQVEIGDESLHRGVAREKTSQRRLAALRRHLTSRARVLEVGVRDGSFGDAAAREFEYVGIDPRRRRAARAARSRGLEVYCSTRSELRQHRPRLRRHRRSFTSSRTWPIRTTRWRG